MSDGTEQTAETGYSLYRVDFENGWTKLYAAADMAAAVEKAECEAAAGVIVQVSLVEKGVEVAAEPGADGAGEGD